MWRGNRAAVMVALEVSLPLMVWRFYVTLYYPANAVSFRKSCHLLEIDTLSIFPGGLPYLSLTLTFGS